MTHALDVINKQYPWGLELFFYERLFFRVGAIQIPVSEVAVVAIWRRDLFMYGLLYLGFIFVSEDHH